MRLILLCLFSLFFAISCTHIENVKVKLVDKNQSESGLYKFSFDTKFKYTSNISVENRSDYQLITLYNPWQKGHKWISYLIYPKANQPDTSWPKTDYQIPVPVNNIAVASASSIGFVDELKELSKVSAISERKYVYNQLIRSEVDDRNVLEIGASTQINIEQLLASKAELFIQTPFSSDLSNDSKISAAGIPIAYNGDWLEINPLGRAEWIKFIGLFLRKEQLADSIFNSIEANYYNLKNMASEYDSNVSFLVGGLFKDVWYMPAGGSYKAFLFKDAATNYTWQQSQSIASLPLSIESVIKQQLAADYWIEAPYKTYSELSASNPRYAVFKAFKDKHVYHFMQQTHTDGANNYWERGVCRPDEVLSDLICIFHPEKYHADLHYYGELK